jgi:hypothetical protein
VEFYPPYFEICCESYLVKPLESGQSPLLLRSLSPAKNWRGFAISYGGGVADATGISHNSKG